MYITIILIEIKVIPIHLISVPIVIADLIPGSNEQVRRLEILFCDEATLDVPPGLGQ